jgi:hypothetical protein
MYMRLRYIEICEGDAVVLRDKKVKWEVWGGGDAMG